MTEQDWIDFRETEKTLNQIKKVLKTDDPVKALSNLLDTPINGQRPRNCANTKLFTSTVLSRMIANSLKLIGFVQIRKAAEVKARSQRAAYYRQVERHSQ